MAEISYASNGKGNLGVTLGAIGTGLGVLGSNILGNGLGGLFNNGCNAPAGYNGYAYNRPVCCSDDELVTRYDAGKDSRIATLEMEKARRVWRCIHTSTAGDASMKLSRMQ